MFCPQCPTEYREGFYTCRDCGVSLISELLPEPAPEWLEFAEILISLSASDMAMIKSLLNSRFPPTHKLRRASKSQSKTVMPPDWPARCALPR